MSVDPEDVTAEAPAADDYDLLPYPSMPYPHTQPVRLAAVAALYGLAAPAPERARVLELGCAAGGNLIPLAARFPEARFLGIDLARRHIDDAKARIAELGLSNIEMRQADLASFAPGSGNFDYVVCHGVFSWVPNAVQDAIFRICREVLVDNGLAVISYNVLPGWHTRGVIRDLCLRYAGAEGSPQTRVAKARSILTDIAASANPAKPYGLLLRNEAQFITHRPASYILGEFLVPDNSPCHVQDFVKRADQRGLAYLCEAELEASVSEIRGAAIREKLQAVAGADPIAMEQATDDFTGRTFRCSILAKTSAARRGRDFRGLGRLHIAADFQADPEKSDARGAAYKDARGRTLRSEAPVVARALARLAEARPETLTFAQLLAPEAGEPAEADAPARLANALAALVEVGQVEISSAPLRVGRAHDPRPAVWALARAEAASGQPWITNLAHAAVALKPAAAILLPHLDGSNDRERLAHIFAAALRRGDIQAPELEQGKASDDVVNNLAENYVERVLDYLAANALLLPAAPLS